MYEKFYTPEVEKEETEKTYTEYTTDIVSKVGYLLGVGKHIFENEKQPMQLSIYNELEENKAAKIIRSLSKLRYLLIRSYDKVNQRMMYEMKNIDRMDDIFDVEDIKWLENNGVSVVKVNYRPNSYIMDFNRLIADNINNCKDLFPLWVEWEYIRKLFMMYGANTDYGLKAQCLNYSFNAKDYPYQVYMGWKPHDKGNVLHNDRKFLKLLYALNKDKFEADSKVVASDETAKSCLYGYLANNSNTVFVVDCENSNPYKLYGTIKGLDFEQQSKIKKILLFDDVHTTSAWRLLNNLLNIPIEHVLIERIKESKSLVDMRVTAEACREHYENKINSFVLCSSDSDYWPLITTLNRANFLMLVEDDKCGADIKREMAKANIPYCSMDDFCDGDINDIKVQAVTSEIKEYIKNHVKLNVNDMLDHAYTQSRVEMTDGERKMFYENYIKSMRLVVNDNGDVDIVLK